MAYPYRKGTRPVELPPPVEPTAQRGKFPYERPVLVVHGNLQTITQDVGNRGLPDGVDPFKTS